MPLVTATVFLVTSIVTALNVFHPEIGAALQRTPAATSAHEWWRFITPILVNRGAKEIAFNLTSLFIIGVIAERWWGRRLWIVLYLVGAFVGEIAGLRWKPFGAGNSVAVCGLLGAVAVRLLAMPTLPARFGGLVIALGALVLVGVHDLHGPPLVAGALVAAVAWVSVRGVRESTDPGKTETSP